MTILGSDDLEPLSDAEYNLTATILRDAGRHDVLTALDRWKETGKVIDKVYFRTKAESLTTEDRRRLRLLLRAFC